MVEEADRVVGRCVRRTAAVCITKSPRTGMELVRVRFVRLASFPNSNQLFAVSIKRVIPGAE